MMHLNFTNWIQIPANERTLFKHIQSLPTSCMSNYVHGVKVSLLKCPLPILTMIRLVLSESQKNASDATNQAIINHAYYGLLIVLVC